MRQTIRLFLLASGISFAIAGLSHFGILLAGYEHREAAIAESLIAVALLAGWGLTRVWAAGTRLIGVAAQTFAILLTLVGAFTIAIGVGPRTAPDIAFHAAILPVLAAGLTIALRSPDADARRHA